MLGRYIRFVLVKLVIVLFAAVGAGLTALLVSMTVADSTDPMFYALVTHGLPAVVFFAFIYSFESKIRLPERSLNSAYYAVFTIRETSVYAIFLIPVAIAASFSKGSGGFIDSMIAPHMLASAFGASPAVDYIADIVIYACVSVTAHYIKSKKPIPAPVTAAEDIENSENNENDEEADDE